MSPAGPSSLSILLIEDNPGDRRLAEIALAEGARDAGIACEVSIAEALAPGLEQVQRARGSFDAVLLDLNLPDASGLEGLRRLRTANPSIPIIVLTGFSDLASASEALKFGAGDYLEKDEIKPKTLLRAIRYAIERRKSETELMLLARTDPLTGLLNRRAFFEELEHALIHARRSENACAVIVFDIDRFKEINDVFGHKVGDDLLIATAKALRTLLRETDAIGRMGGDEFAIVATHLRSAAPAMEIAEKVVKATAAIRELGEVQVAPSISVGISVYPMDDSDAEVLLSHADMAMYKSKASKRGSVNFYDTQMDAAVKARHVLKRSMHDDIAGGMFYLAFQPIVDSRTRRMVAAEGLARWRISDDRIIAPDEFIPIAEESGSIASLGGLLLADACACIRQWTAESKLAVPISLNISPIQCRDPGFGVRLIDALEKSEIAPALINIEITESTIFNNLDVIAKNLEMMRAFGVGIHIDDFGTGYSSLSLLRDLPLNALKIDRSFVADLGTGSGSETIVQAVVELSRKLGFQTIAEGVETEEQVSVLRDIGVDSMQGFYFSRPITADQLATWLNRSETVLIA